MEKKPHIHKQSVEESFFKLVTSHNPVTKGSHNGKPTLVWGGTERSTTIWDYETEEQRDNDFNVVMVYRTSFNLTHSPV